jgi:uncharacterized Zn finger protein (UPF0148 family)
MICKECGNDLQDTDVFCPKCGARVVKERRCPDCGAVLRDGMQFCAKCGKRIEAPRSKSHAPQETLDIPIEAIERNILSETEANIRAEQVYKSRPSQNGGTKRTAQPARKSAETARRAAEPVKRKAAAAEAPHKTKRPSYQERDWEEEDWEDDEDEGGVDVITIMTAVVGCVLLVVIAILAFKLYQQYAPKDYEKAQEQQESEEEYEEGQEMDESSEDSETAVYTLTIVKNVNVRDNPSTSNTNVLKVAQAGETYECYGTAGDGTWYEIRLEDGTTGYVFQDYVSVE